ncbi:hypothetical protein ATW55_06835 [Ferroacidibacillus organovorans]|uniref:3-ketoacyl-ACP reductase n=1 Tax=Ferroacidibacillus organovorans TaxID=1765683 RepID=A0A101XQA9_9BACL|nr:hypothetical protein ATW55_06835 [Ferroacidibacillus organovorans]
MNEYRARVRVRERSSISLRRYALITGSAKGLAVVFAHHLAKQNYDLILNYRHSRTACETLAETLEKTYGARVTVIQADMTKAIDIAGMLDRVLRDTPRLDAVIHSAGPFIFSRKRLTDYDLSEWQQMIDGNLTSAFHVFRRVIPTMRRQGFGRIVTIGFDRVEEAPGWPYRAAYAAAKVGLASLTRSIAMEERECGITANMICPGDIRGAAKEQDIDPCALDSPATAPVAGDLAQIIDLLLDPRTKLFTGNVISLTGGVDVISKFDTGKLEVRDAVVYEPGSEVYVIPWQRNATILSRDDHPNRRSIYTVQSGSERGSFTHEQFQGAIPDGV